MDILKFQEIKQKAIEDHIPIIMDETLEYLDKLFLNSNNNEILEIGTGVGYSAICFSRYLSENGIIDTIEKDIDRANIAIENVKKIGLEKRINVIKRRCS